MEHDVNEWQYIGWAWPEPGKHGEADVFMYYWRTIGGKKRFINVILHKNLNTEVPYAVFDSIDMSNVFDSDPPMLDRYQKK